MIYYHHHKNISKIEIQIKKTLDQLSKFNKKNLKKKKLLMKKFKI